MGPRALKAPEEGAASPKGGRRKQRQAVYHLVAVALTGACLHLLLEATPALARTWRVAKDGSGDFSVIQPAVNAATPGDTILIGAGRYAEHAPTLAWGDPAREACVVVAVDSLTLIGESPQTVVVGPETYEYANWGPVGVGGTNSLDSMRVEGIGFVNNYFCLTADSCHIEIKGCWMQASGNGIGLFECNGGLISGCEVQDCEMGLFVHASSGIRIEDCRMLRAARDGSAAIQVQLSANIEVTKCTIDEGANGITFHESNGEVAQCRVNHCSNYGINSSWGQSEVVVLDSAVLAAAAVFTDAGGSILGERSIFEGSVATLYFRQGTVSLRNCHILNAGGWSVQLLDDIRYSPGTYDLTGNWWGTTDPGQIDAWIRDANDNPQIGAVIQYMPFLDHPVGAEHKTLGGIKGMFR